MSQVRDACYLVVEPKDPSRPTRGLSFRVTKNKPASLRRREKAIRIDLNLPASMFSEPDLCMTVTIPEDQVSRLEICADVQQNIQEVIEQQLGIVATVNLVEPVEDASDA